MKRIDQVFVQPLAGKRKTVMELLWDAGRPLPRGEFLDRIAQCKGLKLLNEKTPAILLGILLDEGMVRYTGRLLRHRRDWLVVPTYSRDEYRQYAARMDW